MYSHKPACGCTLTIGEDAEGRWHYWIWQPCEECYALLDATQNTDEFSSPDRIALWEHWEMGKMGFLRLASPWTRFAMGRGDIPESWPTGKQYDGPTIPRFGMTREEMAECTE